MLFFLTCSESEEHGFQTRYALNIVSSNSIQYMSCLCWPRPLLHPAPCMVMGAEWSVALSYSLDREHREDAKEEVTGDTQAQIVLVFGLVHLDDEGFDASILVDFRQRLLEQHAEERLLE